MSRRVWVILLDFNACTGIGSEWETLDDQPARHSLSDEFFDVDHTLLQILVARLTTNFGIQHIIIGTNLCLIDEILVEITALMGQQGVSPSSPNLLPTSTKSIHFSFFITSSSPRHTFMMRNSTQRPLDGSSSSSPSLLLLLPENLKLLC